MSKWDTSRLTIPSEAVGNELRRSVNTIASRVGDELSKAIEAELELVLVHAGLWDGRDETKNEAARRVVGRVHTETRRDELGCVIVLDGAPQRQVKVEVDGLRFTIWRGPVGETDAHER